MPLSIRKDPRVKYRWTKGKRTITLSKLRELPKTEQKKWKRIRFTE